MQDAHNDPDDIDDRSPEALIAIAFFRLEGVLFTPSNDADEVRDRDRDRVGLALRSLEAVVRTLTFEKKLGELPRVTEEDGRPVVRRSRPAGR